MTNKALSMNLYINNNLRNSSNLKIFILRLKIIYEGSGNIFQSDFLKFDRFDQI